MFMEGGSVQDLEKILQVRGAKKGDFTSLIKSIENKNSWLCMSKSLFSFFISKEVEVDKYISIFAWEIYAYNKE